MHSATITFTLYMPAATGASADHVSSPAFWNMNVTSPVPITLNLSLVISTAVPSYFLPSIAPSFKVIMLSPFLISKSNSATPA